MNENRLKISNPQRIARILRRICQASLPVVIRAVSTASIAVKGRAATVNDVGMGTMRISNISEKGIIHLVGIEKIQVEFVMMSTKVVFMSQVLSREDKTLLISLPTTLVSIERRKNARYNCSEDLMAFLDLSVWRPKSNDMTAPPFYPHFSHLAGLLVVSDLSFGGLCAVARFPSVCQSLTRGVIDDQAKLLLPMQDPLAVGVEIRWLKRIREHVNGADDAGAFQRSFRFGIEFVNQSDQVRLSIRQFIQQLSQAGAI